MPGAALGREADPRTPRLHPGDPRREAELDPGRSRARRQHREKVGAVELPVGPPVARDGGRAERHARHQPPGAVVAELHRLGHARNLRRGRAEPERLQHRHAVRRDLQARAHLGQRRRLLEEHHPGAALRQRRRRR